jgi:hypothetical protein
MIIKIEDSLGKVPQLKQLTDDLQSIGTPDDGMKCRNIYTESANCVICDI